MSNSSRPVLALGIVVGALASGCTSTRTIARPLDPAALAAVNAEARDRDVDIVLRSVADGAPAPMAVAGSTGGATSGVRLELGLERASWEDEAGARRSVPIESVREIRHLSAGHPRLTAGLKGAGLGLLLGAAAGAVLGLIASPSGSCEPDRFCLIIFSPAQYAAVGAAIFGGGGLIAGGIFGAVIGDHTSVSLDDIGTQSAISSGKQ